MAGNLDDLDSAFELPEIIDDAKLRGLYEVLVARMRAEASHLPMNTVQQLLIERICYNYVVMKAKENGSLGGFNSTSVQKDFNTFWLTMTAEFNRMLGKVAPMQANDRKTLLKDVQEIIISTLGTLPDPRQRSELLARMAAEFEKAGI